MMVSTAVIATVLMAATASASTGYWLPKKAARYVPPCLEGTTRPDLAPDGVFRCASLPAEVTFPMGFELRALEDRHSATLITVYPGGALVFHYTVTTWRASDANIVAEIDAGQDGLLRQLTVIDGVEILGHKDAKTRGAPIGRSVTFTDRQGQVRGEMRTFILTGWGVSVIAFGSGGHPLAPGGAIAGAFLDSLRIVEPAAPPALELSDVTRVRLPAGAYRLPAAGAGPSFYLLPGALAHMSVFDGGPTADCTSALAQARSAVVMKALIEGAGVRARVDEVRAAGTRTNRWRGELGARTGPGSLTMVGLIHCAADTRLVMVQLNGESPLAELSPLLDGVATSLGAGP